MIPLRRSRTTPHARTRSACACFVILLISGLSHGYGQALDQPMPADESFSIEARELVPTGPRAEAPNPLATFIAHPEIHQAITTWGEFPRDRSDVSQSVHLSQRCHAVLNEFDHLVNHTRAEDWRWPELGIGPASDWTTGSPVAVRKSLRAVNLCAISAVVSGDQDQALATFTSLVKFSDRIQRQPCGLAHLVVSTAALRMSEVQLERTLVMRHMGADRLSRLQQQLTIRELDISDIQRAMRIDYTQFRASLPQLADADDLAEYQGTTLLAPFASLLLKPGITCTMRLEYDRTLLAALGRSWKEGLQTAANTNREFIFATRHLAQRRLNPNPLGEYHHQQHLSKMPVLLDEFAQCITAHRLTLLQIAIRRYELDHDKLPARLDELVPKYLPTVPTDPFANAPMRWDPKKQALYSVGLDFIDNGGAFWYPAAPGEADMGMLYWWGEPGGKRRNTPSGTITCTVERRQ